MLLLYAKFRENIFVMLPVVLIVTLLNFTFVPLGTVVFIRFLIAAVFIIIGLSLFLVGVDLGVAPLGSHTGNAIIKSRRLWIIIGAGLVLGFLIAIAEPGLIVYANQVAVVTQAQIQALQIIIFVSIGLAILVGFGFVRIIFNLPLPLILVVMYGIVFVMSIFASPEYLAIAFDASGATTGIVAVPFLLSLSMGLSKLKKDQLSSENDSFGLVSIASIGAIIALLTLGYFKKDMQFASTIDWGLDQTPQILKPFGMIFATTVKDSILALFPVIMVLVVLQIWVFKLERKVFSKLAKGFIYSLLGLLFFLIGANGGFMNVGAMIGTQLVGMEHKIIVVVVAFFIGFLTIIAEPAVSVLTHQIEDVTTGYVKRSIVLMTIGIGVGFAISISVLRIITPGLQLWHILLPGYIIALSLMAFTPRLFVGIAFDAGGVATGPLTATFTLAFIQGIANAHPLASIVIDGFGMIALVALAPIITLQLLGISYKVKSRKRGVSHE